MKIAYLFILLILISSCTAFENENNELAYRWESNELVIENGTSETFYYAAFEQEILAVIDWAPVSTEENELLPNSFKTIKSEDIYEYEPGDTIVLFYWSGSEPPYEIFESVKIET
ncbi:MAG: hypothetical protein JJ892_14210 [Balneola sp.]|nr:hypothetical protein [Balneola sp.]MBO6649859.1 hypothetical protein [Balneola sp.]MBO6712423.1 hypothetical protein [Balneola sp.]MBO6801426.1 hypothetical protein [Balneola sp.]MBO6871760.1 hypothetical protein [Balneola sp.]